MRSSWQIEVVIDVDVGVASMRCRLRELPAAGGLGCIRVGWFGVVWVLLLHHCSPTVTMAMLVATARRLQTVQVLAQGFNSCGAGF